jgi:hypothetical protein
MDRRSFLGLAGGALALSPMTRAAGANLEGKKGLRLSVTWGMLVRMPVPEAMALLSRLGYDAFEMFEWRSPMLLEAFLAERKKFPLFCACLVANKGVTAPGCGLVNPREREGFLRELCGILASSLCLLYMKPAILRGWGISLYESRTVIFRRFAGLHLAPGRRAVVWCPRLWPNEVRRYSRSHWKPQWAATARSAGGRA